MNNNRRITLMRPSQIFNSFMDEFFNSPSFVSSDSAIQVNVSEDEDNVYVDLKAPGFTKEDIEINIEGDLLTVSGTLKQENEEEDKKRKYYTKEIRSEEFSRSVSLPSKVDAGKSKATVKDGMVKIEMPKLPESKAQKIAIMAE